MTRQPTVSLLEMAGLWMYVDLNSPRREILKLVRDAVLLAAVEWKKQGKRRNRENAWSK